MADFRLSKQINEMLITSNSNIYGVTTYMEPKFFVNNKYKCNIKSDIYSFGVIL